MGASGRRIRNHLHTTGSLIHHVEDSRTDNRARGRTAPGHPRHGSLDRLHARRCTLRWAGSRQRRTRSWRSSSLASTMVWTKPARPFSPIMDPSPMTARVESSPFNRVMPSETTAPHGAHLDYPEEAAISHWSEPSMHPMSIPRFSGPPASTPTASSIWSCTPAREVTVVSDGEGFMITATPRHELQVRS